MYDPTESKTARITRWVIWGVMGTGLAAYEVTTNPDRFWGTVSWAGLAVFGYFAIRMLFVEPLENQIRALSTKIDALRRQIGASPD